MCIPRYCKTLSTSQRFLSICVSVCMSVCLHFGILVPLNVHSCTFYVLSCLGFRYLRRWNFRFQSATGCNYAHHWNFRASHVLYGRESRATTYAVCVSCIEVVEETGSMSWRFIVLTFILVRSCVWVRWRRRRRRRGKRKCWGERFLYNKKLVRTSVWNLLLYALVYSKYSI